ncbi:MAG: CoA transferase [Actinomycetia bacterium]|nr:CoA transferase [Actinomycetes bacterium]
MNNALAGVRVVDMTHALAGPSATRLLADLGADVVKVENPDGGDFTRSGHPYVFQSFNRDKRSLALDVKQVEGLELVRRLVAGADVFVHSQRPGTVERMGLGRDDLRAVNPDLIYASFAGFGFTGLNSQRRAVDAIVQAESGLAALQGAVLGNASFVDEAAGLSLAYAVLAAIIKRDRTGEVDDIEVNLFDTALYLQSAPIAEFSVTGKMHEQADYARRFATVGVFDAADGPLFLAAYFERDWEVLCDVFDRPDLAKDERFATAESRLAHVEVVHDELRRQLGRRPRAEWLEVLEARRVMVGVFRRYEDLVTAEQVEANRTLEQLRTTAGTDVTFPRPPYRFSSRELNDSRPSPALGVDTDDVLRELGLDDEELARLRAAHVIGASEGSGS